MKTPAEFICDVHEVHVEWNIEMPIYNILSMIKATNKIFFPVGFMLNF